MLTLQEANAQPGQLDFVGHYTPPEKTALKDQEDLIRKSKRKVRKLQHSVQDDRVDSSGATSETPTEEDGEEKARQRARTRKKRRLCKEKAEAEKENVAQLVLELAHYRQAEEWRRLAREAQEVAAATAATAEEAAEVAAATKAAVDPSRPTMQLWHVCCLFCLSYACGYKVGVTSCPVIGPVTRLQVRLRMR